MPDLTLTVGASGSQMAVVKDSSYQLVCKVPNKEIKGCQFKSPSGTDYIAFGGANYERGRIKQTGDFKKQCAIAVSKAKGTDKGKWTCTVAVQGAHGAATKESTIEVAVTLGYEAKNHGEGCGILTVPETKCKALAGTLGFDSSKGYETGNWGHLPHGCFVGHAHTDWKFTYYNSNKGTKNNGFKSVCYKAYSAPQG